MHNDVVLIIKALGIMNINSELYLKAIFKNEYGEILCIKIVYNDNLIN